MKFISLKVLVPAAIGILVLSACGGGASDEEMSNAISDGLMSESDNPFSQDQADCIGDEVVSRIGADRLSELEVDSDETTTIDQIAFTDEEFSSLAKSLSTCSDLNALVGAELEAELGPGMATCLTEKLDDQLLEDMMVAGMTGQEPSAELVSAMAPIAAECANAG